MEKTLFIHIGVHKTATTAIQAFFFRNRDLLRKNGILYPGHKLAHHEMSKEFLTRTFPDIEAGTDTATKKYLKEILISPCPTCILSSEDFCNLSQNVQNLKKMIPDGICVKVICYVRRQDDQIEALYKDLVMDPEGRATLRFSEYQGNGYLAIMDYEKVLAPWEAAFGRENIIVRCYEKSQLKKDIFHDFLDIIKVDADEKYVILKRRINQSLDWNVIELTRLCNSEFKDDKKFHELLMQFFENNEFYSQKKIHLLSPGERRDLLVVYENSNRHVAQKYLGREDGRLFLDPLPDKDEPCIGSQKLDVAGVAPVFTKMLFDMDVSHHTGIGDLLRTYIKRKYPGIARGKLAFLYFRLVE